MKEILIRKAMLEDLKIIQDLNHELFRYEYDNYNNALKCEWPYGDIGVSYFLEVISGGLLFLAEYNEKVVGYLAGCIKPQLSYITESFAEIDNMYVIEEYRKFGVGSLLFEAFRNVCREKSIDCIEVTASSGNLGAINFYKKKGFEGYKTTLKCKVD